MSPSVFAELGYGYVTPDEAPFDFELKQTPEDFRVEELPLYAATGVGDHLLIEVEKRELTTMQAISRLARALDRKPRDFGYAGMKDKHALTRQRFSVEHVDAKAVRAVNIEGLRILSVESHASKLRLGHLAGNRFELTLRGLAESEFERLAGCLERISSVGLPNWFGEQRFGRHANGHILGRHLLLCEWSEYLIKSLEAEEIEDTPTRLRDLFAARESEELYSLARRVDRDLAGALRRYATGGSIGRAVRGVPRPIRSLQLSALQSFLFNGLLARRLRACEPWNLDEGDVAWIHDKGACFVVGEEEGDLEERVRKFEISPAGPLFGSRLLRAEGATGVAEDEVLAANHLSHAAFEERDARLRGARRPYRVPVRDSSLLPSEVGPVLRFTLPKGSYATSLVAELRKRILV